MASWLVAHIYFVLLVSIGSAGVELSPEQGPNDSNSLDLSTPQNEVAAFDRTSSWDLSWPAHYAPTAPVETNASLKASGTVSKLGNLHLAAPRVHCNASTYGSGLNIASCQEVWELLPTSTTRRTFGQRTEGIFDVPLPFRILSRECDRVQYCAVNIEHPCAYFAEMGGR